MSKEKEFTVLLRGPSAVLFRKGEYLQVNDYPMGGDPRVSIKFQTRWTKTNNDVEIPGHLVIEVKGKSELEFRKVCERFTNAGIALISSLSFCANGAIDLIEFELGYESTPNTKTRNFLQNLLPDEQHLVHNYRIIDIEPTRAFLEEIITNDESDRLFRAITQYSRALDHWRTGHDTFCLAHLWMAIEALTNAKIRKEVSIRGLNNEEELAREFNIDTESMDAHKWNNKLNGKVRKELLLQGDKDCHRKAKKASDGFEHGFLHFHEVASLATDTRKKMAKYVREAILEFVKIEDKYEERLLSDVLSKPVGYWPYATYLKGKLQNAEKNIAKDGNEHPFIEWDYEIKDFKIKEESTVKFRPTFSLTARIGEGVRFKQEKLEVWKHE